MDNKLTKSRLSNLFSYDWVIMLIVIVAAIVGLELVYTSTAAGLTTGQQFTYFYDETIYGGNDGAFQHLLEKEGKFSYDVLSVSGESMNAEYNVMHLRISVQNGDILITDIQSVDNGGKINKRANTIIDNYGMYSMEKLLSDAEEYLSGLVVNYGGAGYNPKNPELNYQAVENLFANRMRKDNRFRFNDSAWQNGLKEEQQRIITLCAEVADFKCLLELDETLSADEKLFYSYTKYQQAYANSVGTRDEQSYADRLQSQTEQRYALRVDRLNGGAGKKNPAEYFRRNDNATSENVVVTVFDFKDYQPDLQYETITFINTIVRQFSTILD